MNQQEMFKNAVWVTANQPESGDVLILRGKFTIGKPRKAALRVVGLGFFHCYINGQRVGNDLFLPLNSEFEPRENYPPEEKLTGYHTYVPEYDILPYLEEGENVIAIHFGGGWYCYSPEVCYGGSKAIWRVFGEDENGGFEFMSSEEDRIGRGFVSGTDFLKSEHHDYLAATPEIFAKNFDESSWEKAVCARPPETEYAFSDCPADRVIRSLPVTLLDQCDGWKIYDCGTNTSGYPVLKLTGSKGSLTEVRLAEELTDEGALEERFTHGQQASYVSDGTGRTVHPLFTWYGFRYFAVKGEAEPMYVEVIHTSAEVTSSFRTDNDLLNWIHDMYLNTQLTNMHAGIPSDCPHIERRGYTGDGQLVCHAAMDMLDAEAFYRKWLQDIADSQDVISGHIQYTAPYVRSGGGPGGWGCAIVEVPYQFYRHYGDVSVLEKYYPAMLRYFDYLESHSSSQLIISDKKGEWCLGDWCPPISVILPAPFVNNYFYIKSLNRCIEIAGLTGHEADIPMFEARIAERKKAIMEAYFNKWDGNFLGCQQGANAFMADIGLGDERTYANLVRHYKKLGRFDTGIFGTDIVTRVLFENGDGQLAADLLLSEDYTSFGGMRSLGATTLWEYWPGSLRDRSHNHPMFGAVTAYLYDYLMGIQAKDNCPAYREIVIEPVLVEQVNRLSGYRTLPAGKVSVSYEKTDSGVSFVIEIPEGLPARFVFAGKRYTLAAGENRFTF
ncbi:MAG: family 78 glycoside hydrolase catalytic domain [Clostridia bacterium]|nr:family 78 glycoside hydrolase catalytic domain [Clostridia bacterium]